MPLLLLVYFPRLLNFGIITFTSVDPDRTTNFVNWKPYVAPVIAGVVIYPSYFHPLSKYPGPKLWATSPLPYSYNLATGALLIEFTSCTSTMVP